MYLRIYKYVSLKCIYKHHQRHPGYTTHTRITELRFLGCIWRLCLWVAWI